MTSTVRTDGVAGAGGTGLDGGCRGRLREWVRRYLPAEVAGTLAALAAAWWVHAASGSLVSAAVAGTVGESLGYYGCMAARVALRYDACHRHHRAPKRHWLTGTRTARDLLVEFGPAELVDGLAVRPSSMYLATSLLGDFTAGVVAGKLAADVVFYGLAVAAYELKKRYLPMPIPKE
ncbi:MAG TPA: hypothetical protein VF486_03550 [Actinomycetes bacterium]